GTRFPGSISSPALTCRANELRRFATPLEPLTRLTNFAAYPARYTTFPPTIVATTFPVNCQPSNGVLCDNDRDLAASNVHRFLGSKIVTSAKLPRASDPRPRR